MTDSGFRYYIAYFDEGGVGCAEVVQDRPIRVFADVKGIAKELQSLNGCTQTPIVLNWMPLESSPPPTHHPSEGSPRTDESGGGESAVNT